uniref:Putative P-loop containing nucleoside triphosphate hydrolase protein n=1 Tax=Moniliophthora roreri TaxID=221103 RepID=A0A0W0G9X5_MONRR
MMYGRRRTRRPPRKGNFNPEDEKNVKHTKIGVWDLYEEKQPELERVPLLKRLNVEHYLEMYNTLPFVWRMMKDIGSMRSCWFYMGAFLLVELVSSLIPALSLWYSGQLLQIVQTAVDQRTVDKKLLLHVAVGRFFYSVRIFRTIARLDVPTFDDAGIQRQFEQVFAGDSRSSVAWEVIRMAINISTTTIQLLSQLSVLATVLKGQRDGTLLALLCFSRSLFDWVQYQPKMPLVWAATTRNEDYLKMEGLKKTVSTNLHRQEMVVTTDDFKDYSKCSELLGEDAAGFWPLYNVFSTRFQWSTLIKQPFKELPQIVFTLRAVQYPSSIPLSLASLNLITQTATTFSHTLFNLFSQTGSVADSFATIRQLYEIMEVPNRIADGDIPFPENTRSLQYGIAVEFRNVSFRYPECEEYALRNVSFKIEQGQLCVIVGRNGSGKSTILKLIARLYDPEEGQILIDGRDIKALKLADLRRAMAVLFQDYTHFPLSIKDNIGLGDPAHAEDEDRIEQAAVLGGAAEFIEKLPDQYDTYLKRPVGDVYSTLSEGTKTIFGRPVNYQGIRGIGNMKGNETTSLSGGQMQRIALSRTFMRTLDDEQKVGLLLFDEPSASLDPTAEHDLFERLRRLRGQKTMIFSTHRFGNLTRHADLILYMNDSLIIEEGTHADLIKADGEYARLWNLQAQAFLS